MDYWATQSILYTIPQPISANLSPPVMMMMMCNWQACDSWVSAPTTYLSWFPLVPVRNNGMQVKGYIWSHWPQQGQTYPFICVLLFLTQTDPGLTGGPEKHTPGGWMPFRGTSNHSPWSGWMGPSQQAKKNTLHKLDCHTVLVESTCFRANTSFPPFSALESPLFWAPQDFSHII